MQAGDIVLVEGAGTMNALIRWAQRRDYPRTCQYTHAAIAVSAIEIVQATRKGVVAARIRDMVDPYTVVPCPLDAWGAGRACTYARAHLGTEYGYVEDVGVGIRLLTSVRLPFADRDARMCSELVADALIWGGWRRDLAGADTPPAALADALITA